MEKLNILNLVASALNRKDEEPNIDLAKLIVEKKDKQAIKSLVENLTNKDKAIQNDCIKVLYEIGALQPKLISSYSDNFSQLLSHKNNRLQWGAMTALNCVSTINPAIVFENLSSILKAADKGSVITRDQMINILVNLAKSRTYKNEMLKLLEEQLLMSPTNQLPMYAERIMPVVDEQHTEIFINALQLRLNDIEKESKRKRIEKVINKLNQALN